MSRTSSLEPSRRRLADKWTSPPFISCYISLIAAVAAVVYILATVWPGELVIPGTFSFINVIPTTSLSLALIATLLVILVRSLRIYQQVRIREYLVLSLIVLALLSLILITILIRIWGFLVIRDWKFLFSPEPEMATRELLALFQPIDTLNFFMAGSQVLPMIQDPSELYFHVHMFTVNFLSVSGPLLITLMFTIYFMRMIWLAIPVKTRTVSAFLIFYTASFHIAKFIFLGHLWYFCHALLLVLLAFYTFFYLGSRIYGSIDPPSPTPNIKTAARIWRVILILFCFYSISTLLHLVFYQLEERILMLDIPWSYKMLVFWFPGYFSLITMFVILVLFGIIALRYPEGLLIFETHLLRAKKAYEKIGESEETQNEQVKSLSQSAIVDYLKQVPPEYFERTRQ